MLDMPMLMRSFITPAYEVLDRFPETAGYLKTRAQKQDTEIARILAARHIETAFLSALTPANLASPSALLALDGFLANGR